MRLDRPLAILVFGSCVLAPLASEAQTLTRGPEQLLPASNVHLNNTRPRVAFTADGAKHVAWVAGDVFGQEGVFVASAPSAGAAYGAAVPLAAAMDGIRYGLGDGLELDVRGDRVLVSWEGTDFDNRAMWFARSTDLGSTWESAVRADPDTTKERAYNTGTLFPDGRVIQSWIVYDDVTGDPSHELRVQDANGDFLLPANPAAASPGLPCECCNADPIVLDDGTVVVAYRNNENNQRRMYVARSTDGGATFPASVRVDQGGSLFFACPSSPPSITAEGSDVLVVWGKVGGASATFHAMSARSTDGGVTFAPQIQVDDSDGLTAIRHPTVARQGDVAVAVWTGNDPVTGQPEIWAATSLDGGSTWGPEEAITGDGLGAAVSHAGVAISPADEIEIVWSDSRDGTERVYRVGATVDATDAPMNASLASGSAFPNPFRRTTTVRFSRPLDLDQRVLVLDVTGRIVTTLAGEGELTWDGSSRAGSPVPSGVYYLRPEGRSEAVRVVRLRN
ncbi:MAG: hypothetical protein KC591_16595 [Gemmatimonadetes bacterium]|nr:hypothetical protein [Gemmatimonadota bacterium]